MAHALLTSAAALPPGECETSHAWVEAVVSARLLNTFLREVGGARPLTDGVPEADLTALRAHGTPLEIVLPKTNRFIYVSLARSSLTGHHDFGGPALVRASAGQPTRIPDPTALAELLIAELGARASNPEEAQRRVAALCDDVADSFRNTRLFAERARQGAAGRQNWLNHAGAESLLASERALVFGHPFHPTPKSCQPGDPATLARFRPELGASFSLHHFAVAPELFREDRLAEAGPLVGGDVLAAAASCLGPAAREWPLLPCHPWQAEILRGRADVRALIDAGLLVPLGPLGEPVLPTSSVRTVYLPRADRFCKLPLDVRITNFVRNNPLDHLERSMTASRALAPLRKELAARGLHVLAELGYRSVDPNALPEGARSATVASLAVLFRAGLGAEPQATSCAVVAALLEPTPAGSEAPLGVLLWRAARSRREPLTAALVCAWLKRYLEIGLRPLLTLFFEHGISLEAHVQNTLVAFEAGWPCRTYVRDLEGTSFSRQRLSGLVTSALSQPSRDAIVVEDVEAWQRLLYYVLVNHTAHLIAMLALHGPAEEWQLWQVVRAAIEDLPLDRGRDRSFLDELLSRSELPAKANLISRFSDRAERPLYLPIPNPLCATGPS